MKYAVALNEIGEVDAARSTINQVLADYPNSEERPTWWLFLGNTYREREEFNQASQIYSDGLDEFPENIDMHIALGWSSYYGEGGFMQSMAEFERAIALNPESAAGYYAMGQLHSEEKNFSEAYEWFSSAVDQDPENKWYAVLRANSARNAGNTSLSIEFYNDIIEQHLNYDRVYHEIAWAYYLQNQYQAAKDAIEKAILLAPRANQWYFVRAGTISEASGDIESALSYYHKALGVNPGNSQAIRNLKRLEE